MLIKSRKTRWADHVARMEDRRLANRVFVGDVMERDDLKEIGVDGRIVLK